MENEQLDNNVALLLSYSAKIIKKNIEWNQKYRDELSKEGEDCYCQCGDIISIKFGNEPKYIKFCPGSEKVDVLPYFKNEEYPYCFDRDFPVKEVLKKKVFKSKIYYIDPFCFITSAKEKELLDSNKSYSLNAIKSMLDIKLITLIAKSFLPETSIK